MIQSNLARNMERIMDGLSAFPFREMDQASRAADVELKAAAPAVASSVVASSAVAGGNPFVGPALDLPVMDGVAVLLEALPEITGILGVMPSSEVQALGPLGSVEPLLPVTDLVEQFEGQQYLVPQAVEQLNSLDLAPAGLSTMGAVAASSNPFANLQSPVPGTGFEQPWVEGSPSTAPEPIGDVAGTVQGRLDRVGQALFNCPWIVYAGASGLVFVFLSQQYPQSELVFDYAEKLALIVIGGYWWVKRG